MRLFRYIAQFWRGPVFCEDCMHCVSGDKHQKGQDMCEASPLEVDCSDIDTFVNRNRKIDIINTFKSCEEVRRIKSSPRSYDLTCWKFDKKVLDK